MVLLVRRSILRSASEDPQMSEKCRRQAEGGPQTEETMANGKAALILSLLRWTPVGCQGCACVRVCSAGRTTRVQARIRAGIPAVARPKPQPASCAPPHGRRRTRCMAAGTAIYILLCQHLPSP